MTKVGAARVGCGNSEHRYEAREENPTPKEGQANKPEV